MKQKVNLPEFTADVSFLKTIRSIRQTNHRQSAASNTIFQMTMWSSNDKIVREGIVPAATCDNVNCDAALATCILLFNPVSCGLYSSCCLGGPSFQTVGDPDCRNEPCAPGCPADMCIQSMQQGLSSDNLSSEISSLKNDLKKQLNKIERCACGLDKLVYNGVSPLWANMLHEANNRPTPPQPYSMY